MIYDGIEHFPVTEDAELLAQVEAKDAEGIDSAQLAKFAHSIGPRPSWSRGVGGEPEQINDHYRYVSGREPAPRSETPRDSQAAAIPPPERRVGTRCPG
ncbi:hypothetical protein [Spirillospora sp. NPDC047279]|uniref:hypothetical protein n=1 Tax=Spirillospora sp. NPDC047279 TaxID=3155478 RepID=UPI0033E31D29